MFNFTSGPNTGYFQNAGNSFIILLGYAIQIIMIGTFVYFLIGVFQYIKTSDEKLRKAAGQKMLWGIVGLFVMTSVWGLVNFLSSTTNISPAGVGTVSCPPGTTARYSSPTGATGTPVFIGCF